MLDPLKEIQEKIGYTFRDPFLLEQCFTHSSYANAHGGESNERLEFLGDALLGFVVAEELYAQGLTEGEMTTARAARVSADALASVIREEGLERHISAVGDPGEKAVSSLFEALVAGIYLDGGMDSAKAFVHRMLALKKKDGRNYKGDLQEYLQARGLERAEYVPVSRTGADHQPHFKVRAEAAGLSAEGEGGSLRAAEKQAAKNLLSLLAEHEGEED